MPDSGRIPGRSVRIEDALWDEALAAAEWRGDPSLSWVIRKGLMSYVRSTNKKKMEVDGTPLVVTYKERDDRQQPGPRGANHG